MQQHIPRGNCNAKSIQRWWAGNRGPVNRACNFIWFIHSYENNDFNMWLRWVFCPYSNEVTDNYAHVFVKRCYFLLKGNKVVFLVFFTWGGSYPGASAWVSKSIVTHTRPALSFALIFAVVGGITIKIPTMTLQADISSTYTDLIALVATAWQTFLGGGWNNPITFATPKWPSSFRGINSRLLAAVALTNEPFVLETLPVTRSP